MTLITILPIRRTSFSVEWNERRRTLNVMYHLIEGGWIHAYPKLWRITLRVCCDLCWVVLIVSPKEKKLFSKRSQIELNEIMRRAKLLNVLQKGEVEVSFSSSKKTFSKRYWLLRNISEIQMGRVIVVLLGDFYALEFTGWVISSRSLFYGFIERGMFNIAIYQW